MTRILKTTTFVQAMIVAVMIVTSMQFVTVNAQTGVTNTINFDPPSFSVGNVLLPNVWISDIAFIDGKFVPDPSGIPVIKGAPYIFAPTKVTTSSPPYALSAAYSCDDQTCSSGGNVLRMKFKTPVSRVSMHVGNDETYSTSCFPEGTACPTYARLVGFNEYGKKVADSGDIFITDIYQGGGTGRVPINTEVSINGPVEYILSASLYVGTNALDPELENWPIRAQIDDVTYTLPSNHPLKPAPPTITITTPQPGQSFAFPYHINLAGNLSAPGGLLAFCTAINKPTIALDDCRQLGRIQRDGTFNFQVTDMSKLGPTNNILYAFAYDSTGQMGQAQVPITLQIPPAPNIRIINPDSGEQFDSESAGVWFWGEISASGGLAAFCTRTNIAAIPTLDQCNQIGVVSEFGYFGFPIDQLTLNLGSNTLYAFAYDRWGQTATASVQFNMPTDLYITAMEITQGIQTEQLPLNTNGIARYSGVKLVWGGKTVVRVFVKAAAGGPYTNVMGELCAWIYTIDLSGNHYVPVHSCLWPDNYSIQVSAGGIEQPTLNDRADPSAALVFTLPHWWTEDQDGTLSLEAKIEPSYSIKECANCKNNNTFTVTDVHFEYRDPIAISPVELRWTTSSGNINFPNTPTNVFSRTANISPLSEGGLYLSPYIGSIDITDLVQNNQCRLDRNNCMDKILDRLSAFAWGHGQFTNHIIGVVKGLDVGETSGLISIASQERPLTAIAHELYHQFFYHHAGLNCPGLAGSGKAISWPPDDRGLIQGFGLDRSAGSGPLTGTYRTIVPGAPTLPPEYFDFMSYCPKGNEDIAWISVRNWNAFGSPFPNGQLTDPSTWFSVPTTTNQQTLRLFATTDGVEEVNILSVRRGNEVITNNYIESSYQLILRDKNGDEISRSFLTPIAGHSDVDNRDFFVLSAEIPSEGATSLEITYNDKIVATRVASPNVPSVTILNPTAGNKISGTGDITLNWDAKDADGDPLEATVEYSTDDGQTFRVLTTGVQGNQVSLSAQLFSGTQQARIRVTVNDGFNDGAAVSDVFSAEGSPPQVKITEPTDGLKLYANVGVRLVGQAFDDSGQMLIDKQLHWFDKNDEIGIGSILDGPNLLPGLHTIRLEATDSQGRTSKATVNVEVLAIGTTPTKPLLPNWWWIALIALLGVAIVVILIVLRRRSP